MRVLEFLRERYGDVSKNYDLGLPSKLKDYQNYSFHKHLEQIHSSLQEYRGFTVFVKTKKLPRVDYYVHRPGFVVEFDETQHFTFPRFLTLKNYPENIPLGFPRQKWMDMSRQMNKKDNDPPYRDEQRAWYDTLRDFSASILGNPPTVRLFSKDMVWCALNVQNEEHQRKFHEFIA